MWSVLFAVYLKHFNGYYEDSCVCVCIYNIINRPTFTKFSLGVSQSPFRFCP